MSKIAEHTKEELVYTGSWYDEQFADFLFSKREGFTLLRERLLEPSHTVAQTGETYRVINNWDANGLLFDKEERENGWRKFSFIELVWIQCLVELRKIGLSVSTLKKIRDSLFYFYPVTGKRFDAHELAFFITRVIGKQDVMLITDAEGLGNFCLVADYENSQILQPLPASYVVVSLNSIYAKVVNKPDYAKKNTPLFVLSDKEQEVVGKITLEKVSEVNLKAENGRITKADYKTKKVNPENALDELREMIKEGGRKEVTFKNDNNRNVQEVFGYEESH